MALKIKYTEQKAIPEGYYVARLDGLESVTNQFGDSVKWVFTIQEPREHVGVQVTAMSSTKVSPKSKMFAWLQAFGVMLNPDEEFDIETLLGNFCKIRVKNREKKTSVDGKERSTVFSNVDAIAAYIPPAQNATPPPPVTAPQTYTQPPGFSPAPAPAPAPVQNIQPQPTQNPPIRPQNNTVPPEQLNPEEDFDF
jgi:hypothetical protein